MNFPLIVLIITLLSLVIWLGLLLFWGQFWLAKPRLTVTEKLENYPPVAVIIPARNEAEMLPRTLRSLLKQDYPGKVSLILVDDHSTDGTGEVALREFAKRLGKDEGPLAPKSRLEVVQAKPLPPGWTGKLWALEQGIQAAKKASPAPRYLLLTDADIKHDSGSLRQLVTKAEKENLELVSLMVLLRCESFWEKLLIPAFVFFFQKLYPFPWVNNPRRKFAAAAGGCILIKPESLDRIGGMAAIRQALIDDCSLAAKVKSGPEHPIWLGLTTSTHSLRPYAQLKTIWDMVARTAYTQLYYSPWLLLGTLLAMSLIYLLAPLAVIYGLFSHNLGIIIFALVLWLIMALAYFPTIRLYKLSPLWTLTLPAIALLYSLMTLDSAFRHWRGQGGNWKGRVYGISNKS